MSIVVPEPWRYLLWAIAIWLVGGRRRKEVRAIAVGIILAGILVLVVRRVAGTYLVDNLTSSESVRPSLSAFWSILSHGLAEAAWSVIAIGVVAANGVWLTGEGARAGAARRWLAPWMARTDLAWLVFAVLLVLVLWVLPLHRFVLYLILAVLTVVGFEVVRRQIVSEYEAEGSPERRPLSAPWGKEKPPPADAGVDELERLAKLRSEELLTEDEYAAAKGRILPPAGG